MVMSSAKPSAARWLSRAALTALAGAAASLALSACEGRGECVSNAQFFREQIWAPILSQKCLKCHNSSGAAKESKFILEGSGSPSYIEANLKAFDDLRAYKVNDEPLLLVKPTERGVTHGGGLQIEADSKEYEAMQEMLARLADPVECEDEVKLDEYFGDVALLDEEQTLRKASLALLGRLPTQDEYEQVRGLGIDALDPVLDAMMEEDEFYDRLGEIYNDLFLTDRYVGGTAAIDLLYDEDHPMRRWFDATTDETLRNQQASRANVGVARTAINLVKHVVRTGRPFTEILTADYMVFTPYSARSFGQDIGRVTGVDGGPLVFEDNEDPKELKPGKLKMADGTAYPHAGVISDPIFWIRFPTTETNRNRHRARMIYRFFLATDLLRLAERPIDPTAIADFNPTMNNPNCSACHGTMDPMAGTLMNFDGAGRYTPSNTWFEDMRVPGFKDETLPFVDFGTGHQWLAQRVAQESLFPVATVQTVFTGLTGQDVLLEPGDLADPHYVQKHRAFEIQDFLLKEIAEGFAEGGYDLRFVVRELIKSEFFRAANVSAPPDEDHAAELMTVGTASFLPPEQLSRKVEAVTGYPWRQNPTSTEFLLSGNEYRIFYGGIDSDSITSRIREPNGLMANIAARMANEMACWSTARDFSNLPPDRRLFPFVEPDFKPEDENGFAIPAVTDAIKANLQHLHKHVLGEQLALTDPQIDRSYQLFVGIWKDGKAGLADGTYSPNLPGGCASQNDWWTGNPLPDERKISADPDYTIRAWMGVMTYLLSDYRFLHQ